MMKQLINNLVTIFNAGITAGRIRKASVIKGIHQDPAQIGYDRFPCIEIDDGGQRVDTNASHSDTAQLRVYTVILCFSVNVLDITQPLDDILDFTDEVKAELELQANRPMILDGHNWGINITNFSWGDDNRFFRGSQVMIEFYDLEDRFSDY